MAKTKPRRLGYIVFDNDEELDKYENGEHHSNKGIRDKKERFTKQPDFISMSDEDIISEAEKILSARGREFRSEQKTSIWQGIENIVLEILYEKTMELMEDSEKRAMVLERINRVGNKFIETAKFYKGVFHAIKANEKPKALKLTGEIGDTEVIEKRVSVEMTEAQKNRLLLAMAIAADTLKDMNVITTDTAGKELQIEKEEGNKILIEETMKGIKRLMGNDFELDEPMRDFLFEYLKREADEVPISIQS